MTGMKAGWPWSPGDVVLLADGALAARSQMNVDNPWTVLTGWRTDAGGGEWLLTDDEITALGPRLVLCETAAVQIALAAEVALAAANRADPNVLDPATGRPAFIGDVRVTGWHVGEAPPVRLRPPVDGSVVAEAHEWWRLADNGMMTHESAGAQIAELYASAAAEADADATDDLWFTDDDTGSQCLLVLEPQLGVEHPDCGRLAKVFVDLDSFWCVACGWRGRVSGAWVLGLAGVTPDGNTGGGS